MLQPRETVLNALFALISKSTNFVTASRKFQHWAKVGLEARPALFLVEKGEEEQLQDISVPTIGYIEVTAVIYVNAMDADTPASIINPILDALDAAIAPEALTQRQTLGGLVTHVWKEGKTIKIPGDIDGDGMAFVPLKILVP